MGEKIVGHEFSLCSENTICSVSAGGVNRSGGDEAAAKNDYHERSDEENQMKRKERMLRTDGGSLNSWRQIVKKRGPTQDGRILCRNGMIG